MKGAKYRRDELCPIPALVGGPLLHHPGDDYGDVGLLELSHELGVGELFRVAPRDVVNGQPARVDAGRGAVMAAPRVS